MVDNQPRTESPADKMLADLRELQSEYAQLSELDEMERAYALRLVESIKNLQAGVDIVIPLALGSLRTYKPAVKQAYLASEAVLVMTDADGGTLSVPLAQLSPQEIMAVVQDLTAALRKAVSEKRKAVGARVELFERILKDLKKVGGAAPQQSKRELLKPSNDDDDDLIRSSITTQ